MVESDDKSELFECSLSETIIAIMISKPNGFSPHEILGILGDSKRNEQEITSELEVMIKRNPFIKKRKRDGTLDEEYYIELHTSVQKFLDNLATKTKQILKINTYKSLEERTEILRLNAFPFKEMAKSFPLVKSKPIRIETLRQYISAICELGYLKNNGFACYYFDMDYLESMKDTDKVIELEQFWTSALNIPNIIDINFHGLQAKSTKKLKTTYDNLIEANNWKEKDNLKEKRVQIALGTIKIICFSNKEDQTEHLFNIHYEGSLLCINSEKRAIRGKFSVQRNDFEILFAQIKQVLYESFMNKEIEFTESEFDNFILFNVGYNIDVEDEITQKQIQKQFPDFYFSKSASIRDFTNNYSLRCYRFYDKFAEKRYMRILDAHANNPTQYTFMGMLDVLQYTGEQMINEKIMSYRLHEGQNALVLGYKELKKTSIKILDYAVDKAKQEIKMFKDLTDLITEGNNQLIIQVNKRKDDIERKIEDIGEDMKKEIDSGLKQNGDLLKETTDNLRQDVGERTDKISREISEANKNFGQSLSELSEQIEGNFLANEVSVNKNIEDLTTQQSQILSQIQIITNNQTDNSSAIEKTLQVIDSKNEKLEDNLIANTDNIQMVTNYTKKLDDNFKKYIEISDKKIELLESLIKTQNNKGIFNKIKRKIKGEN